jgi:hypothetical protein
MADASPHSVSSGAWNEQPRKTPEPILSVRLEVSVVSATGLPVQWGLAGVAPPDAYCIISLPLASDESVSYRMSDPAGDAGTYTGPKDADGKAHGIGRLTYDCGRIFLGEFCEGTMIEGVQYAVYRRGTPRFTMVSAGFTENLDDSMLKKFPFTQVTDAVPNSTEPVWNHTCTCTYDPQRHDLLEFSVYNRRGSEFIGSGFLPRRHFLTCTYEGPIYLKRSKEDGRGKAQIKVSVGPRKDFAAEVRHAEEVLARIIGRICSCIC